MNKIISSFQMKRNTIISFEIQQKAINYEYDETNVNFGVDYSISAILQKDDSYNAEVDLYIILNGNVKDEDSFQIKLDMQGEFEGDCQELEVGQFEAMLKVNGLSTLMQLSRAYVTAATALSGFAQPINFPMINIFELIQWKENKEKEG